MPNLHNGGNHPTVIYTYCNVSRHGWLPPFLFPTRPNFKQLKTNKMAVIKMLAINVGGLKEIVVYKSDDEVVFDIKEDNKFQDSFNISTQDLKDLYDFINS